jgi:hypothetical protein
LYQFLAIRISSYFPRRIEYGDFLITSMNCTCVCVWKEREREREIVWKMSKISYTASVCVGWSTHMCVCVRKKIGKLV